MIWGALIFLLLFAFFAFKYAKRKKYERLVFHKSAAIQGLNAINEKFAFLEVQNFDMQNNYDNADVYRDIQPMDYLIYQLVYIQKDMEAALRAVAQNSARYSVYMDTVKKKCVLGKFESSKNTKALCAAEKRAFQSLLKRPTVQLQVNVRLVLRNMQGRYRTEKKQSFSAEEIETLLRRVKNKSGQRYNDDGIWKSLCRVERGKVTNRMRFEIFKRDHYRCRKCGRKSDHLEIDHIYPISRGGKSTFDNLQTLCPWCNYEKENRVDEGIKKPKKHRKGTLECCPFCGVALVEKKGKSGVFYACPNAPKCKYTKS